MKTRMVLGLVIVSVVLYGGSVWGFTEGSANNFFGFDAGLNNTTGFNNSFMGGYAGVFNTTGNWNSFFGYSAGYSNTTGSNNTFIGSNSGGSNTTGVNNSFIGGAAGNQNITGNDNTFLGNVAGYNNSTGGASTFVGSYAGFNNTTGGSNTFVGYDAGHHNSTGDFNTFMGRAAGVTNTIGGFNTFVGVDAGFSNTTGGDNTFLGDSAGYSNTDGGWNTFLGDSAGHTNNGWYNTFAGGGAGTSNTSGWWNTFLGWSAGHDNITGDGNVFLGYRAGYSETGSNKLYIANSNTSSPLIYGDFGSSILKINGSLGVGKTPSTALDVNGTVNATSFTGNGSGLTNLTELDPKVGTLTAGKWCFSSDGTHVTCTQNAPLMAEIDPKVGTLTSGLWCTSDGSHVNCTHAAPILTELDPKVGTLTLGQWCTSDGTKVNCSQSAPVTTDKVGPNTLNHVPRWNGSQLVTGIISDTGTVATVNGALGVGVTPLYFGDFSSGGVAESQLHFSLSGTDTGGWITSVLDNNFFLSSGAMYDQIAGGWVQKSPDGKAVIAGSGSTGYRVQTRTGCAIGTVCSTPVTRLLIDYSGNVGLGLTAPAHPLHLAGGAYSDGANWIDASSREYKDNIREISTEEALVAFQGLNPVAFTYKSGKREQHVGFIAEDVPELVATKDRKGLSPMDIVAVLTKVVQEQQKTISNLREELNELKGKVK